MRARRYILTGISAVYFGALVGLTFVPGSDGGRALWIWPFVAFVPVGILLVLLLGRRRWWAAVAFSVLGSAWTVAARIVWMPAGYAHPADVVWGALGAAVGVTVTLILTSLRRRSQDARPHDSRRLVAQAAGRELPQD